jgi:hypothetical protein
MSKAVVVATFSFPLDAQIAKASLDSVGIPAFIADEHTINMQWLYSNAMGGVRLLVAEEDAEQAKNILQTDFSDSVDTSCASSPEKCPKCHSEDVAPYTQGKKSAFLVFILAGFPLFFYQHGLKCNQCQHFWLP